MITHQKSNQLKELEQDKVVKTGTLDGKLRIATGNYEYVNTIYPIYSAWAHMCKMPRNRVIVIGSLTNLTVKVEPFLSSLGMILRFSHVGYTNLEGEYIGPWFDFGAFDMFPYIHGSEYDWKIGIEENGRVHEITSKTGWIFMVATVEVPNNPTTLTINGHITYVTD